MGQAPDSPQQGWLDRLVRLFRSSPPERAAAELEQLLDAPPSGKKPEPEPPIQKPAARYKGVTF